MVAPLVGAWIEIFARLSCERKGSVAPLVGAWIEIREKSSKRSIGIRRSSRGSVD